MDYKRLSKRMALVLRHRPWEYELELDEEGWTSLDNLLEGLNSEPAFKGVTRQDLEQVIATSAKSRYEIQGERVRALYGHSIPGKLKKTPGEPPEILYHGTAARFVPVIMREGLKPMSRQYVHLSVDTAMAQMVGARKGQQTVILRVRAAEAARNGVPFYLGNEQVWLADAVPATFLSTQD